MKVLDIIRRAEACCQRLPERVVSEKTLRGYRQQLKRMFREPVFDPLLPGIARDTYAYRRAAFHTGGRNLLVELTERCKAAARRNDPVEANKWAAALNKSLDRIEPALVTDPPLKPGASALDMPPSRWHNMATPGPRRGRGSKKHALKYLSKDWTDQLWNGAPTDWPHIDQLAVHLLIPSRPEDLVPGARPHGWSAGAKINLVSPRLLEITIAPAKTHGGKFGAPSVTIKWDPTLEGGPAAYLADRCAVAGGSIVVSISGKNKMRKALAQLGRLALPKIKKVVITPYVIRNQLIADIKATVGAGAEVAAAANHCNDRTQAKYGRAEHGRRRKGYLGVVSMRAPRAGNVARAKELAAQRCERPSSGAPPEAEEMTPPTI